MSPSYRFEEMVMQLQTWGDKGLLNPKTAGNWRQACERVQDVLEEHEREDVRKLDVDSALERFANLNSGLSPSSFRTYRARVEQAIQNFLAYKRDPFNWRPPQRRRTSQSNGKRGVNERGGQETASEAVRQTKSEGVPSGGEGLVIPFPLRSDVTLTISGIPSDLTVRECDRIAAFIRPLAVDFDREKPEH